MFDQISNKDHNSDLPVLAITQDQGAIPREMIDYHVSVTDKSLESYKVVEVGDFIISLRSFQGGIEFSRYKGICSPAYVILRLRDGYSADYFRHYLKTERFIAQMTKNLEGLRDGKMVSFKQFSELELPVPSHAEQQKIADFLDTLNDRIRLEAEKLDNMKNDQRGVIQQLFSANGETMPKLRFPEFQCESGWDSELGNMVFDQISNKDHNSDLPVLAITQDQGAIPREMIDYHVSVTDKSLESYKVVEVGDFIISLRSFQGGIEFSRYKGICSPAYVILRLRDGYSADYFRHYLKTERFIAQMTKNLEGLRDGKMVSFKQFSELELPVPSRAEQQKIADFLDTLNAIIDAQSQKIESLKTYKNGLMQQMFPRLNEVEK